MKFSRKRIKKSYRLIGISAILVLVFSIPAFGQQDISEYQKRLT